MSGIIELEQLLSSMGPKLMDEEFVFCTVPGDVSDYLELNPLATFRENEGLTLVLTKKQQAMQVVVWKHLQTNYFDSAFQSWCSRFNCSGCFEIGLKRYKCKYNSCYYHDVFSYQQKRQLMPCLHSKSFLPVGHSIFNLSNSFCWNPFSILIGLNNNLFVFFRMIHTFTFF